MRCGVVVLLPDASGDSALGVLFACSEVLLDFALYSHVICVEQEVSAAIGGVLRVAPRVLVLSGEVLLGASTPVVRPDDFVLPREGFEGREM